MKFAMLASGSRGNCALIQGHGPDLLLDLGLGPREMTERLKSIGATWDQIGVALLTHTHSDHVNSAILRMLAKQRIILYCHQGHLEQLNAYPGYKALDQNGLVRFFEDEPFFAPNGMWVEPIRLSHDADPTYGFRVEAKTCRRQRATSVGYVADTGSWDPAMAEALFNVDLLAIEFNHDVGMQFRSGRPRFLIERVLGPKGHLSNEQGAELATWVMQRSRPEMIQHLVLLHLSGECNRDDIALRVARQAVKETGRKAKVMVAAQELPHPVVTLRPTRAKRPRVTMQSSLFAAAASDVPF